MDGAQATNEQNLALARQLYDATGRGDWEAAAALLADDFVVIEADTLPYAGTYRGKNALRDLFVKVMGMLPAVGLEIHAMTAGDDHVVGLLSIKLDDGEGIRVAEVFRMRDGKVAEIVPYYFDTEQVCRIVAQRAA